MRRTWMLLLVTVLLAVFLAVPAMATEGDTTPAHKCDSGHCCECENHSHEGWTSLNEALENATVDSNGFIDLSNDANADVLPAGNYYLSDDLTASVMKFNGEFTICLNGHTWTGNTDTTGAQLRCFNADVTGTVINIVDCSTKDNGVSGGKIVGGNKASDGGAIYISTGGAVRIYDGTIQGGDVGSAGKGGSVYLDAGELNMYGGVITGGRAFHAGNVYMNSSNSVFNLYKGTVSNGLATGAAKCRVGNIYVVKGTLNLGVEGEDEPDELNNSVRVIDGEAFFNETTRTDVNCGNIWVNSNATMNMYYGTVSGGKAANSVGNIRLDGKLNMYGGVVRDGKITMGKKTVDGVEVHYVLTTPTNHNIYMNGSGARLNMTGGHIYGYFSTSNATAADAIKLEGSAKIYAPDTDGDGLADDGLKAAVAPVLGKLNNNAKIAIQMVSGTTLTYNTDKSTITKNDWAKYVSTQQIVGYGSKWLIWKKVDGVDTAVYQTEATGTIWHCVCGANSGEDHIGDCNTYDVQWTAWSIDSYKRLPDATELTDGAVKYYYVSDTAQEVSLTTASNTALKGANHVTTLYFDLNGKIVNGPNSARIFSCHSTNGASVNVTFTDSSENHTGKFVSKSDEWEDWTKMFWIRDDTHSMSFYRIEVDATGSRYANGTTVMTNTGGTLKMFNTTVRGGTVMKKVTDSTTGEVTGAYLDKPVTMDSTGTVTMEGCTLYGGNCPASTSAGVLRVNGGRATLTDCTIHGGNVSNGGAFVVSTGAELTLEGSTIIGGTAAQYGGAIYSAGDLRIIDSTITGGNAVAGGSIYSSGSVSLTNTDVKNGKADLVNKEANGADKYEMESLGGNIYVAGGDFVVDGGTITEGQTLNATDSENRLANEGYGRGGNVYIVDGTFTLKKGTISDGKAGRGGNIYVAGGIFNLGDPVNSAETDDKNKNTMIIGGQSMDSNGHGGNGFVGSGRLNMYYGTVSGGKAIQQGANIRVDATMYMYGGIVRDGHAGNPLTLNGRNDTNFFLMHGATFNMSGGHVYGHVRNYTSQKNRFATITLSGDAKIYSPVADSKDEGLRLCKHPDDASTSQTITIRDLTSDAKIAISCDDKADGRKVTTAPIADDSALNGLYYYDSNYKLRLGDDDHLYLVTPEQAIGAIVNDGSLVVTLPEAIEMATGTNDFVKLLSDYEGERLVVADNLNLDLNGKKIVNGLKLASGELKLVDSANANYVDNSITNGNRLTIETEGGTIARAFVTGGFTNYGHNYRFLVLKHENGTYSAHRIYLAVQNPVLYPVKAAMSFKTVLGCDATVAGYVKEYGVNAVGPDGSDKSNYLLNDGTVVLPYEGKNQNAMTTAVVNILTGAESDADWAATELKGQAYIKLNDYFYGKTEKGTPEVGEDVTSAQKGTSLQQLVKAIDGMTLSNPQKVAVAKMYTKHFTLMSNWGLEKIPDYADTAGKIERHCLCGDTKSTDNPCAATGHRQLDWQPLPENYKGERLYEGNYYLTKDLELTAQMDIVDGNMVCLDTNGHNITLKSGVHTRLAIVRNGAVFNMANSQFATKGSTGYASCLPKTEKDQNGNGGILIGGNGNMSLYKGVTIAAIEGHKIGYGLVAVNGSLNIYGGNIIGTTLDDVGRSSDGYGGAVYVGANGYFFINDGTIQAGDNNKKGGAIYTAGGETHIQGNAKLVAGTGTQTGGLLFVAGGKVNVGVSLTGGQAELGAVATVTGGTLNLNGSVTVGGENATYSTVITGGTAQRGGAIFVAGGTLNVNGAKIAGGVANIYEATTTGEGDEAVTTTVTNPGQGGAIFVENGEVKLTNKAMVDGGQASNGGNFYITGGTVSITDSFVCNGYADRLTVTAEEREEGIYGKYGSGSNFYLADGTLELSSSTVEGGKADKDNSCDGNDVKDVANRGEPYGGSVLYASGGTVTVTDSKLLGNRSAEMWKHGGTIFNNGATITVTNSTITASYASTDGTVLYNNGTNASFTMTDTILDASVLHGVEGLESVTYAGAVRNVGADFTMNGDNSEIRGFTIHHANGGGALYVNGADSTIVMNGGTISGGSGKDGDSYGGNVAHYGGTFTMNGGVITGGTTAANGGNVYISGGTFTMNGGTITGGTAAANGGNVSVKGGTFNLVGGTISGVDTSNGDIHAGAHANKGGNVSVEGGTFKMTGENACVTGGAANYGGNLYANKGTVLLEKGIVENGRVVHDKTHGGNLHNTGGNVTISGTTIRNGRAIEQNGNVYSNSGTLIMTGGLITGGKRGSNVDGTTEGASTNLFVVTSNFTMKGGTIDGGVTISNYDGDYQTKVDSVYLRVGGAAKLLATNGYGVTLSSGVETKATETTPAVYYLPPKFELIQDTPLVTEGENKAEIHIQSLKNGEVLVERPKDAEGNYTMTEEEWLALEPIADVVFVNCQSGKQVSFEEDGIYLRTPAEGTRYRCSCGVAAGEEHTAECKGYDVLWTAWSGSTLPNQPGYWYLSNEDTVVEASTSTLNRDFLLNADGSLKYTEGGVHPFAVVSVVNSDNQPTGTFKYNDGKEWLDYELQEGEELVTSYEVYLDLNGHKIDCASGGRVYSFYGIISDLNGVAGQNSKRQAAAHLTVIDSSEGHTGGMSTAGVYGTKDSFGINSQPQGSIIWMPYEQDSLTTCNVELNASTATHGRGNALETAGTVHLWNTRIIGGTATHYVHEDGKLRANAAGGGAVVITSTGNVTMHGGSITGGKAISEWVRRDYGEMYTSCLGGANVFVSGGIFTMDGGVISGGEVWVENGSKVNDLLRSMPGVGGGVYIHGDGEFHVKGDAQVLNNYYYTYTVDNNGTLDNYYDDTYVCQKTEKKASNVYIGSGAIYNDGLTDGARIGLHRNAYEGVLAYTTSDCSAYLYRDDTDGQISGAIFDGQNQALALGNAQYRVGYGMSNIQPTDKDLETGLSLNGYGNTAVRTTDKLYNTDSLPMDGLDNSTKLQQLQDFKAHSDLAATAVAITDAQGDTVLLISVDLTAAGSDTVNTAKDMISLKTGIPKQNIVISAGHQHSCPSPSTIYYKDAAGAYTNANGTVLTADQDRVVKTDYARTFYHGVVNAAVEALDDRKEATVTAGILDTTSGGNQYNFVRNKTITVLKDYTHTYSEGTIQYGEGQTYNVTDNHYGVESSLYDAIIAAYKVKENGGTPDADQQELIKSFSIRYESEVDTTMQLVKFSQTGGKEIVLANFQTHPHKAGGSTNYQVHSDVIGAFRYYLKNKSGAEVIYFSGASGNVNTTGALDYSGTSTDNQVSITDPQKKKNTSYVKLAKSAHYGESLAALASTFISGEGKMKPVTAARDVAVTTRTVEYTIQAPNITDDAISRINEEFLHWNGGEQDGKYYDGYDPTTFQSELWWKMVGQFSYEQANEKIYSAYHASRAYTRYKAYNITGDTTGEISISAYNIGGIGFVAAPYEMFQESGQAIKGNVPGSTFVPESGEKNAFEYTIIASQANGGHGYIATKVAYDNGGGYSSTDNSLFAAGTAETLVNEYVSMLNGMHK